MRDPLHWEIDTNPSNIYESPNFTLKCKTKIVSYAPWLYNDSRMSRDHPTGRYYTHKRTIEEKAQQIKPVNVHALNFIHYWMMSVLYKYKLSSERHCTI